MAVLDYLRLVPVRSFGYRTRTVDVPILPGSSEIVVDVVAEYDAYCSALNLQNYNDSVAVLQMESTDQPVFRIPPQVGFTRDETWISWFKIKLESGTFSNITDLSMTIAPVAEVRNG